MKTSAFGLAAAFALGVAAFAAPASATTVSSSTTASPVATDISSQGYVNKRVVVRRGPNCMTKVVRTRGPMGRVVVRKTRVCR